MNKHRARAWTLFVATAVPLLAVLGWLTATLMQLDRDELQARRHTELHERMRLALWRMDSWLSPQLAREAMRPPSDYRAFAPAAAAWTKGYSKLAPDEVLVPSPLLGFESELFLLHFELLPGGEITSPQVPTGNQRDVAESSGVAAAVIARAEARLAALQPRLQPSGIELHLGAAESLLPLVGCNDMSRESTQQAQQSVLEFSNRQVANQQNMGQWRQNVMAEGVGATFAADPIGPMVPFWIDGDEPLLVVGRRVRDATGTRVQGAVLGWAALQRQLKSLVSDLFESDCVHVRRCALTNASEQGTMLATVPARLETLSATSSLTSGLPMATIIWVTWGVTLLGLSVLAFTLRTAIGFGERRARFASAVTHELRTPLTTFRMYSEMLADGMVEDPKAKQEYLSTLQRESDRLARVVENVLVWSRLEEGRFASRRERHAVPALVDRQAPTLQRRLEDAGMQLRIRVEPGAHDAVVATDEDAVGQILFNLVDNAAKYAHVAAERTVEITVGAAGEVVRIEVRDHGPGVPAAHRRGIFAPFDRGTLAPSSNDVPGVGLGLPLARGLAQDLGGDLAFEEPAGGGACFVLTLPRA